MPEEDQHAYVNSPTCLQRFSMYLMTHRYAWQLNVTPKEVWHVSDNLLLHLRTHHYAWRLTVTVTPEHSPLCLKTTHHYAWRLTIMPEEVWHVSDNSPLHLRTHCYAWRSLACIWGRSWDCLHAADWRRRTVAAPGWEPSWGRRASTFHGAADSWRAGERHKAMTLEVDMDNNFASAVLWAKQMLLW